MEYLNDELTEMQQVKRVVQQAIDQYPRLAVFQVNHLHRRWFKIDN